MVTVRVTRSNCVLSEFFSFLLFLFFSGRCLEVRSRDFTVPSHGYLACRCPTVAAIIVEPQRHSTSVLLPLTY